MTAVTGQTAPDFTLRNQHGQKVTLSGFRGTRNVILMFSGILLFGWIIVLLDWLARRKDRRQSGHQPPA
jgi:hypothetical protein